MANGTQLREGTLLHNLQAFYTSWKDLEGYEIPQPDEGPMKGAMNWWGGVSK